MEGSLCQKPLDIEAGAAYSQALQWNTIYMPQVVVQCQAHCLRSSVSLVISLVPSAARFTAAHMQATVSKPSESTLQVNLTDPLRFKVDGYGLHVFVYLYENGHVTDCLERENRVRVVTNDFVVKGMEKACSFCDISAQKMVRKGYLQSPGRT